NAECGMRNVKGRFARRTTFPCDSAFDIPHSALGWSCDRSIGETGVRDGGWPGHRTRDGADAGASGGGRRRRLSESPAGGGRDARGREAPAAAGGRRGGRRGG